MKVISGGQTGVDRAGLEIARERGFETGGKAPGDFLTENGPDPSLKLFGLVETTSRSYNPRTAANVRESDGTVLFGDMNSSGSQNTIQYCIRYGRPYITNPTADGLVRFVRTFHINTLNVAGNRASKLSPAQLTTIRNILRTAFLRL